MEEITLTYVVVKVWDLRRLVVPMTHFLEKPFQNWSKVSPEISAPWSYTPTTSADVAAVRPELGASCQQEGRETVGRQGAGVQVTGCSERPTPPARW